MNFYQFHAFLESKAEDLISQNPELKVAYDMGVKNFNYLNWILKLKGTEPIRDIAPVVIDYDKKKQKLVKKDLFAYKDVGELRSAIETASWSKEQKNINLTSGETTFIGKFGDWYVVVPHTTNSSCHWGKGTTWCTSYTQSGNMFMHYTVIEKKTLFYLNKEAGNTRKDPNSKICIGLEDGKIIYGDNVTVNSSNQDLNESDLRKILGDQFKNIISAIKNKYPTLEENHPARDLIKKVATGEKSVKDLQQEFSQEFGYNSDFYVRALSKYDLTIDGIYEIMYQFVYIEKNEDVVKKLMLYSKNPFRIAKLLIDHFEFEPERIKPEYISEILRFGSVELLKVPESSISDIKVNLYKMGELMRLLGSKNLYSLSFENIKELFEIVKNEKMNFITNISDKNPVEILHSLFEKYAPAWDREIVNWIMKNQKYSWQKA